MRSPFPGTDPYLEAHWRDVDTCLVKDARDALDAIDRAEDQIERGEVRDWNDVRDNVRSRFLGK